MKELKPISESKFKRSYSFWKGQKAILLEKAVEKQRGLVINRNTCVTIIGKRNDDASLEIKNDNGVVIPGIHYKCLSLIKPV